MNQALEKTQLTIERYGHETVAQEPINLAFISVKSETLKHVFAKDFEGKWPGYHKKTDFNSSTKDPLTRQVCRVLSHEQKILVFHTRTGQRRCDRLLKTHAAFTRFCHDLW